MGNNPGDQANVVFKLYMDKQSTGTRQDIKFEDLERRINNLEKIFGPAPVVWLNLFPILLFDNTINTLASRGYVSQVN